MSKSKGNYVGVTDPPNDMFGKIMSIPDKLMANYYTLLTDEPEGQVRELVNAERTHPRQAKAQLARTIVARYYGQAVADAAEAEFNRVFSAGETPTEMPEVAVPADQGRINIIKLIALSGLSASNNESRRLVEQNAVSLDNQKVIDVNAEVTLKGGEVLRVGKRRFGRVRLI
jgi:tyrosyl-tRNA synthetase